MVMLWINYSLDPWALLKVKNISSNGKHRPYVSPITSGSCQYPIALPKRR